MSVEFTAPDPNVEVIGTAIRTVTLALGEAGQPILAKHGLEEVDPEAWYPMQTYLDFFRDLAAPDTINAMFDLVSIGQKIPETILLPPDIQTIHDIMSMYDQAYQMNHRGGKAGNWHYTRLGDREIKMVAEKPYPDDFDYGAMFSFCRKYKPEDARLTVRIDESQPVRKLGGATTTFMIKW